MKLNHLESMIHNFLLDMDWELHESYGLCWEKNSFCWKPMTVAIEPVITLPSGKYNDYWLELNWACIESKARDWLMKQDI